MTKINLRYTEDRDLDKDQVLALYQANEWSAAKKPAALLQALVHSHRLVTAWDQNRLVGLGNAISDGFLVVYYPHLLVHPEYQGQGIGQQIVERLQAHYEGFHMQMLVADGKAVTFYEKQGFTRAGATVPLWIYQGAEH